MNEQEEKKKKRGIFLWIIISLLMVTNGITVWLLMQEKSKVVDQKVITETIIVERDNVKLDLVNLKKDYENLKVNDALMQKDINEKKQRIEELIKEAEKHKGDAYIIAKLRKETETLREIMKGYVRTIDSLNTLNISLVND
ncbi:MAG: hypothetical protein ACXVNQ_10855, partial [Bacteroidia bacterium]